MSNRAGWRRRGRVPGLLTMLLTGLLVLPALPVAADGLDPADVVAGTDAAAAGVSIAPQVVREVAAEGRVRVLVSLDEDVDPTVTTDRVLAALAGTDHTVVATATHLPVLALELSPGALVRLAAVPGVGAVAVDEPFTPQLSQTLPLVGAPDLWNLGATGTGTAIAVLDTGVETTHPFLAGRVVAEACFSDPQDPWGQTLCPNGTTTQIGPGAAAPCVGEGCDHGTHVAGIAAGNRNVGPGGGVAPGAGIVAVQVFHLDRNGHLSASGADVVRALDWVVAERQRYGIAVVNLSLGGGRETSVCDTSPLAPAFARVRSAGVAAVAASGNDSFHGAVSQPACLSSVIAVGATTLADQVTDFSNGHSTMIDLLAPGQGVRSATAGGTYGRYDGTSMAAPHVAGAFALLRQLAPTASVDTHLALLREAGRPVRDTRLSGSPSFPRLDLGPFAELLSLPPGDDGGGDTDPAPPGCATPFRDVGTSHPFCTEIAVGAGSGMLHGWPDGTFRPSRAVTRQAAVAFLHQLEGSPRVAYQPWFSDVGPDHAFAEPITWAVMAGITTGFPDGTFRPNEPVTRRAGAAFLHRYDGFPIGSTYAHHAAARFTDVQVDSPFAAEIGWLVASQVADGYPDATFRAGQDVTRQALAAWLVRLTAAG